MVDDNASASSRRSGALGFSRRMGRASNNDMKAMLDLNTGLGAIEESEEEPKE